MRKATNQPPSMWNPGLPGVCVPISDVEGGLRQNKAPHYQAAITRDPAEVPIGLEYSSPACEETWDSRLREVNRRVADIHPTVPNPHTLLSTLSPSRAWCPGPQRCFFFFFFCLTLTLQSQDYFAFEWKDPEQGVTGQLTQTRLPQGFKNSPALFDKTLHQDLAIYPESNPQVTLAQYTDDLLIAAETKEDCLKGTKRLLERLGALGYKASAKKAQICQKISKLLGLLAERQKALALQHSERDHPAHPSSAEPQTGTGIPGHSRVLPSMDPRVC